MVLSLSLGFCGCGGSGGGSPEPEPEPEPAPTPAQTAKYTADQGTSAATIETDGTYDAQTYTSTTADQNALRVSYAYMSAAGDTFTKTGDATNTESSNTA